MRMVALVTLALASCQSRTPDAAPTATVSIVLDGTEVARVASPDFAARRALAELLPVDARDPETWVSLDAASADGRAMTIADVADRYPDHAALLFLDPAGRPSLGLFAPARADQPPHVRRALESPAIALVGVARIAIVRTAPTAAPPPPPRALVVASGGRTIELDAVRLDTLPRLPDQGHKVGGWDLRDVLALAGISAATPATITAVGREGSATFARTDLDAPDAHPTLRHNRRGELRLAVGTAVVHDVLRLEVVSP